MSNIGSKKIMASNIERYMRAHELSRHDLSKMLQVPYTTIGDWLKAKTYPRIDKIELMANFFGIEKSDLIEEDGNVVHDARCNELCERMSGADKKIQKMIRRYLELSEEGRKRVDFVIEYEYLNLKKGAHHVN